MHTFSYQLTYAKARAASPYVFASWGKTGHIGEAKGTMKHVSTAAGLYIKRHDLRRTFEDAASACNISGDQRRQLLNHLANDVHGRSYANNPDPKVLAAADDAVHIQDGRIVSVERGRTPAEVRN